MITLYTAPLSAHGHRVELLLRALRLDYTLSETPRKQRSEPWFLELNPLAQIPVLVDDDAVLSDSHAILVYLAKQYDRTDQWLPQDAKAAARTQRWLSIASGEIAHGPALARNIDQFGGDFNKAQTLAISARILSFMESHLNERDWLASNTAQSTLPTIADLACYGYVALAPEGGISLLKYPNVMRWLARVETLDAFFPIPRLLHEA